MIIPQYYENLHMLHENTMPDRSYYVPAAAKMDCLIEQREKSDRIQMLNGNWKFKYYDSIYDLKEPFYKFSFVYHFIRNPRKRWCFQRFRNLGVGLFPCFFPYGEK